MDVLPTRCRLARVLEVVDHICLLCNGGPESTFHIFVECDVVNRVWFQSEWGLRIQEVGSDDIIDWVQFAMGDERLVMLMGERAWEFSIFAATVMDKVWALRNRLRLGRGIVDLARLCISVEIAATTQRRLFKQDTKACRKTSKEGMGNVMLQGQFKVSVDVAFKDEVAAVGWVEKDNEGAVTDAKQ